MMTYRDLYDSPLYVQVDTVIHFLSALWLRIAESALVTKGVIEDVPALFFGRMMD